MKFLNKEQKKNFKKIIIKTLTKELKKIKKDVPYSNYFKKDGISYNIKYKYDNGWKDGFYWGGAKSTFLQHTFELVYIQDLNNEQAFFITWDLSHDKFETLKEKLLKEIKEE